MILALFLVPFNWIAFSPRSGIHWSGRILFVAVTGVFDVLTVIVAGYALYLGWRRARFGPVFLRFERFPSRPRHVGARVAPRAPAAGRAAGWRRPCAASRSATWRTATRPPPRASRCGRTRCRSSPRGASVGGSWNLPIGLRLPVGPYETRLAERPPRYWELDVRGEAPGVDFGATFLVPVYAPPAA